MHRLRLTRRHVLRALLGATLGVVLVAPAATGSHGRAGAADRWNLAAGPSAVVGFRTRADLDRALREHPGVVLRTIPALGVAEVLPRALPRHFATAANGLRGIDYVEPAVQRTSDSEPALVAPSAAVPGSALEWQYQAAGLDRVPSSVKRAAAAFTIAVVDTGADLTAPDIGFKAPITYSVTSSSPEVRDTVGHGTFVAALAAGADGNGEGIAGFGGSAKLMVVQAGRTTTSFTDVDEAAAIVWAVDHGARIVNLSLGGPETSTTERNAIAYAAAKGALVVAAIGNSGDGSNRVEYPAALVQPVGSNGRGGTGLSVGASDPDGARAEFSDTGSHLSLLAPGTSVLSAIPSSGRAAGYVRTDLPGSAAGQYAFGSGTSFAAPEVSGVAALVWAASPRLTAGQVVRILEQTASNRGAWNAQSGYGVIDAAAAVQAAARTRPARPTLTVSAYPARGSAPLGVSVRALVRPGGPVPVTLESFTNGRWQSSSAAQTDAAGRASWRFVLGRGTYRVRVRSAGVVSRTVSITAT